MSKSNIINQFDIPYVGYFVAFETRNGTKLYGFSSAEGSEVEAGADPQTMGGKRIEGVSDVIALVGGNLAEDVLQGAMESLAEYL